MKKISDKGLHFYISSNSFTRNGNGKLVPTTPFPVVVEKGVVSDVGHAHSTVKSAQKEGREMVAAIRSSRGKK